MFRRFIFALGVLLASGSPAGAAPLEAYGKLPNIEQAVVSPSGALVAYIATDGDQRSITVLTAIDQKPVFFRGAGSARVRNLVWAGDRHVIITVSTAKQPLDVIAARQEYYIADDLDLKTGRSRVLLGNPSKVENALNTTKGFPDVRTIAGKPTVFVRGEHFVANEGQTGLFQVDLDSGVATLIRNGDHNAYDWLIDAEGQVLAEETYNDRSGRWALKIKQPSGGWRTVEKITSPIEQPDLVGVSSDGRSILIGLGDEKTGNSWAPLSLETGAWGERTVNSSDDSAILDPATGRVIGKHALIGDSEEYTFFDAHDAAVWRGVTKAFPGDLVTLSSWSADRKKIVVRVDSAELGPAYALIDLNTGQATWLGAEYLGLKAEDISPKTPVRYKAADGLEITGYLTTPRGRDPHGLPLVVLAHGGPSMRDEPGFDWWAQALASRGYAVLQANYRGSGGFGWEFEAAGFGQWGRKMQTDLSDGVRYLAREGLVDPGRVCIVGASYGGYAALAGATIDHGVYRCAVAVAGVANLRDMISEDRATSGATAERFWIRYIGALGVNDPILTRYSPALRAAEAEIPILLIHGRDDTTVPIGHSRQMAAALQRAGKPVEFIELKAEDHQLSRGETRLQMLQATVAFLERNNPPN